MHQRHTCIISAVAQASKVPLHHFCVSDNLTRMQDRDEPVVRKTISLPADLWRQVEDYQFERRVKRDAEAIRQLIALGLEAAQQRQKVKT